MSNGAAYVDLDNDGDLDLVVNNINSAAFIMRNDRQEDHSDSSHNYITIQLAGDSLNKSGIGARLAVYTGAGMQTAEQSPVRGYASTVDKRLHIGVGSATIIDSLIITWPDNLQAGPYPGAGEPDDHPGRKKCNKAHTTNNLCACFIH